MSYSICTVFFIFSYAKRTEGDELLNAFINEKKHESNPIEILRQMQETFVTGRPLELQSTESCINGRTNFIMVDRWDLLKTAFEEISDIVDPYVTLEVQFYGEVCVQQYY